MTTQRQRDQWREDRDLIQQAVDKVRRESTTQQSENLLGRSPIMPVKRYKFVALLDELGYAAARGELRGDLRRVTLELCRSILDTGEPLTEPDSRPPG